MAIKEIVTKTKLDALANSIALKSGVSAPFTIDEMKTVVDNMSIGGDFITQSKIISPQLTDQTITPDQGYDGLSDVTVKAMPSGSAGVPVASKGSVSNHTVNITPTVTNTAGYISGGTETGTPVTISAFELVSGTKNINSNNTYDVSNYASVNVNVPTSVNLQQKTVTPTESVQTIIADDNYDGLSSVEVGAISNTYVGSGITRRDGDDLTASGATVSVSAGYYSSVASKSVASGTAGTPTATKGTVSNHAITVTPSVTNTTGYITGGTKDGTGVTVSASELVSGTYSVISSGTKDVTNYASASVPAGTAGTPSASKGTVSNHSISVTPSVTNTTGFITGDTKTGTAVTVSASELVSGTLNVTANGTNDVTNYASVNVNVENTDFIVTLTKNASTEVWEPDCTYAELKAAYDAGKNIIFVAISETGDNYPCSGNYVSSQASFYYGIIEYYNDLSTIDSLHEKGYFFTSSGINRVTNLTFQNTQGGDATPADVVSGKYFYNSTEGFQTGTLVIQHYYTGSSAPSSSLGADGDIYLQS